jgi:transposase
VRSVLPSRLQCSALIWQRTFFESTGSTAEARLYCANDSVASRCCHSWRRLEPCLIGMEACAGAHYWAREIQKLGHIARLMSPHFVTAYRKNQKNDGNDAEVICEAVGRPLMRFVPIKSTSQQDIQAVHRIRFQLIKWRTALANKVRGLLGEYGILVAQGLAPLRRELPLILDEEENQLSGLFREMLGEMAERLKLLDQSGTSNYSGAHP